MSTTTIDVPPDSPTSSSCALDEVFPKSYVVKPDGTLQTFRVLKLLHTLKTLSWDLNMTFLDLAVVTESVVAGIGQQMTTRELQMHTARTVATYSSKHPDYSRLAARIVVTLIHKTVDGSFVNWVNANAIALHLHPHLIQAVAAHGDQLDAALVHARDFDLSFLSIGTMIHRYLADDDGIPAERPQFMYMRVAISIHGVHLARVLETYDVLSRGLYTHATPVLYNAGTLKPHYSSCFIFQPDAATIDLILRGVADVDALWKSEGSVGISLSAVPARRSFPHSQPGVLALLRVLESHASFLSEGGLRRPCATTAYLAIWHYDVRVVIPCRTARPGMRMKHVFLGLVIPDVFMLRLKTGQNWSLFDPADVPDLLDLYGEDFTKKYEAYELSDIPRQTVDASILFGQICDVQRETGTPFIMYLDAMNYKNNQSHLGMIRSSNLCTEIVQFCSEREPAVCTLASVALPRFINTDNTFNFEELHATVKLAVKNTDTFIDLGEYPDQLTRQSAMRSRSIGIGTQGFVDCLRARRFPFHSPEARWFNKLVFETVYHAALEASCELAYVRGPHPTWIGSPASMGVTQDVMWGVTPSNLYDWQVLRERIGKFGLRNAMVTAQMPTASTACVLGNYEGTEVPTSNVTNRRVFSGDYVQWCPWLVRDLVNAGLWSEELRTSIVRNHGSVAGISTVPHFMKEVYRTAWEIDPVDVVDMAADRGPYIDQSQSMTLHVAHPTTSVLRNLQIHAWERGLKTGMYYLRTRAPTFALPFGVPGAGAVAVSQGSSLSAAIVSVAPAVDAVTSQPDERGTALAGDAPQLFDTHAQLPTGHTDATADSPMARVDVQFPSNPDTQVTSAIQDDAYDHSLPGPPGSIGLSGSGDGQISVEDHMLGMSHLTEHLPLLAQTRAPLSSVLMGDLPPSAGGTGMYTDLPLLAEDVHAMCCGCDA